MTRPRTTSPPVDDPIRRPDLALAELLTIARGTTPRHAHTTWEADANRMAELVLWMHAHLSAPTPGVLPTPWARAPELAEGTLATCRWCRTLIRARGPLPDWAATDARGVSALWCGANPDATAPGGPLPVHEPVAAR